MAKRTKFQIRSDAAKQRWHVRDEEKEKYWRGHADAWRKSNLSKRAYCEKHELAYSSFMAWRREIEIRDREKIPPANVAALLPTGEEKRTNPFVQIRIRPERAAEKVDELTPVAEKSMRKQIEIVLPTGAVIRLDDECNPSFIAKLLSSLNT